MKKFLIEEQFIGYNDVTIYAESEEEAIRKYELGHYSMYDVDMCDDFSGHKFVSIVEEVTE